MNPMWARPQTDMTPVSRPLTSSRNAPNMFPPEKVKLVKMQEGDTKFYLLSFQLMRCLMV